MNKHELESLKDFDTWKEWKNTDKINSNMKPSLKDWIGFLIPVLIGLTIYGFIGYVIVHFIIKFW